ncbi:MAG: hypothetical protein AAGI91_00730 [Bacteroidota bacterium]
MSDLPDNRQLHALVLVSTLRTAAEVQRALAERRAGRDPSEQEAAQPVRAYLRTAVPELRGLVARLRVSLVVAREEQAALVQAFEDRLTLSRLARELHIVHQRLLSLYPAVPDALVEAARLRQQEAERLAVASGDGFEALLILWLDRTADFFEGLEKALAEAN